MKKALIIFASLVAFGCGQTETQNNDVVKDSTAKVFLKKVTVVAIDVDSVRITNSMTMTKDEFDASDNTAKSHIAESEFKRIYNIYLSNGMNFSLVGFNTYKVGDTVEISN